MHGRVRIGVILLLLGIAFLWSAGPIDAQAESAHALIVEHAKKRQELAREIVIEYSRTELLTRGGVSSSRGALRKGMTQVIPAKDMTLKSVNRVIISGTKFRIEDNHPVWHVPGGTLHEIRRVYLFNGALGQSFFPHGMGNGYAQGYIERQASHDAIKSIDLLPITVGFRGLEASMTPYTMPALKAQGEQIINGEKCATFVTGRTTGPHERFTFSPGKQHSLVAVSANVGLKTYDRIQVSYSRDEKLGWVPASWIRHSFSDAGKLLSTTRFSIDKIIINRGVDTGEFEVTYPPETIVTDQRVSKRYRVQSDGSMREVDWDGNELPGVVLQPGTSWAWNYRYLLLSLAVVLLGIIGVVFWKWKKRPITPT